MSRAQVFQKLAVYRKIIMRCLQRGYLIFLSEFVMVSHICRTIKGSKFYWSSVRPSAMSNLFSHHCTADIYFNAPSIHNDNVSLLDIQILSTSPTTVKDLYHPVTQASVAFDGVSKTCPIASPLLAVVVAHRVLLSG